MQKTSYRTKRNTGSSWEQANMQVALFLLVMRKMDLMSTAAWSKMELPSETLVEFIRRWR